MNNYPAEHGWRLWQAKEYPGHHLWGLTHLARYGIEFEIVPSDRLTWFNRVGSKLRMGPFLGQQLRALFQSRGTDLIFSGCQYNTLVLALLRRAGLLRKPLVALVHHPLDEGRKTRAFLAGHDRLLCLSSEVRDDLKRRTDPAKIDLIEWGPDQDFYRTDSAEPDLIPTFVSAGKTARDHTTLVEALDGLPCRLKLYCPDLSAPKGKIPSNVELFRGGEEARPIDYCGLREIYARSFAIAIPLFDLPRHLSGLTSLLDAMAIGKPVIMTRNKFVDIDIEYLRIGIWVDPGDRQGWKNAMTYLLENRTEAAAMGTRAKELIRTRYNIERYSEELVRQIQRVLQSANRGRNNPA